MDNLPFNDRDNPDYDFFSPEEGPGEGVVSFSARVQQEKFLGGGLQKPEKPPRNLELKIGEKVVKLGDQVRVRRTSGTFEEDWTLKNFGKAKAVVEKTNQGQLLRKVVSLNEFRSLQIDTESAESRKDIRPFIKNWQEQFKKLKSKGEIDEVGEFSVDNFRWQQVTVGEPARGRSHELFRGYLMVEPESIPQTLGILLRLAEERKAMGKSTEFKWLLKTDYEDWAERALKHQTIRDTGEYQELVPDDPRIALYSDNVEEILDILNALSKKTDWQRIEDRRRVKFGGISPRRPGTNSFIDESGLEWRSLNWNNQMGYSEHEAADPDWRGKKAGTPTVNFK